MEEDFSDIEAILEFIREHFDPDIDRQVIVVGPHEYEITKTLEGYVVSTNGLSNIVGLLVVGMRQELDEPEDRQSSIRIQVRY